MDGNGRWRRLDWLFGGGTTTTTFCGDGVLSCVSKWTLNLLRSGFVGGFYAGVERLGRKGAAVGMVVIINIAI